MGLLGNAIVKGLSGAAGAGALALTKNPALAATATQLVNQYGNKLVDPALKFLVNNKFSFGNKKLSARDILNKVKNVSNKLVPGSFEAAKAGLHGIISKMGNQALRAH